VSTRYKGIDVYKLTSWVQGPVMLQALNILENTDLRSMGYNSAQYIHTLYQTMSLAFADRDFYYGDPYTPPEEPLAGLLSKEYARARFGQIDPARNDPKVKPGNPYPFMGRTNPYRDYLERWGEKSGEREAHLHGDGSFERGFHAGTTSIQAADRLQPGSSAPLPAVTSLKVTAPSAPGPLLRHSWLGPALVT